MSKLHPLKLGMPWKTISSPFRWSSLSALLLVRVDQLHFRGLSEWPYVAIFGWIGQGMPRVKSVKWTSKNALLDAANSQYFCPGVHHLRETLATGNHPQLRTGPKCDASVPKLTLFLCNPLKMCTVYIAQNCVAIAATQAALPMAPPSFSFRAFFACALQLKCT